MIERNLKYGICKYGLYKQSIHESDGCQMAQDVVAHKEHECCPRHMSFNPQSAKHSLSQANL